MPNCPDCDGILIANATKCSCGWVSPQLAVQAQWHVRLCQGCKHVMIRERLGHRGHELCKWCQRTELDAPSTETKGVLSAHHSAKG